MTKIGSLLKITLFLILCGRAYAESNEMSQIPPLPVAALKTLDITIDRQRLSSGYPEWKNAALRGGVRVGNHLLQGELATFQEFNKSGNFFGISDTVDINPDWYASLAIGAGDGAFYLPKIRTDAFIFRKWLSKKNLVTSVGAGYYSAPDGHIDRSISLGGAYYFDMPLIVQYGLRLNRSNPGGIRSNQQFLAVTYRFASRDTLVIRHGWGSEAYQAIAANTLLVGFDSRETNISWRHYIARQTGLSFGIVHYHNPNYTRTGVQAGIFWTFD